MFQISPPFSRLSAILFALLALTCSGCVPTVTWLPDSSGFICTGGKDETRLIHYDLTTGRPHVLVEDTGAGTNCPAVSPDGKQIALAKLIVKPGQKEMSLQVIVYRIAGKELKRSKVFDWVVINDPTPNGKMTPDREALPQLFWTPKGDKVLMSTCGYTAIYDITADKLIHAGEGWLLIFGTTPVRPDGAGFLFMKNFGSWMGRKNNKKVSDPGFTFVDWDGKEQPLKAPALFTDGAALEKEKDNNKLLALLLPFMYQSGWSADVAQVSWNRDRLRYLTGKGEAVLDRIEPAVTKDDWHIVQQYSFPAGKAQVRIVMKWDEKNPQPKGDLRVEFLKMGEEMPKILCETGGVLIPSPNGKLAAIRTRTSADGKESEAVIVVDDQGEIVVRLPLDR